VSAAFRTRAAKVPVSLGAVVKVPLAGELRWRRLVSGQMVAMGSWCEYRIKIGYSEDVCGYVLLVGGQRVDGSFSRTLGGAKDLAEQIEERGRG